MFNEKSSFGLSQLFSHFPLKVSLLSEKNYFYQICSCTHSKQIELNFLLIGSESSLNFLNKSTTKNSNSSLNAKLEQNNCLRFHFSSRLLLSSESNLSPLSQSVIVKNEQLIKEKIFQLRLKK